MLLEVVYGCSVIVPVVLIVLVAPVEESESVSAVMVTLPVALLPPISLVPLVVKVPAVFSIILPLLVSAILTLLLSVMPAPELMVMALLDVSVPATVTPFPLLVSKISGLL